MRVKTVLALAALALVGLTGCGGGDDDSGVVTANVSGRASSSTSAAADSTKSNQDKGLEYAKCMRQNGIPNFADPNPQEGGAQMLLPEGVTPEQAKAAGEKCKQYLPSGENLNPNGVEDPKVTERLRQFAECMRDNGLPEFPDPQSGGGGIMFDQSKGGVDPKDPKFQAAQKACGQFQPGGAGPIGAGGSTR